MKTKQTKKKMQLMKVEDIKPIPEYIRKKIYKKDLRNCPQQDRSLRYYAYLTSNHGELVKVTVAVRNHMKRWYCKQCAVHGIHSAKCFVKDMIFHYMSGYKVGWYAEGLQKTERWYECPEWGFSEDKYFDPRASVVNAEYLAKWKAYKYSGYQYRSNDRILQYLRIYEQYPEAEYLTKMGLTRYAESLMILRLAHKDKAFRKWQWRQKEILKRGHYHVPVVIRAYKTNGDIDRLQMLRDLQCALANRDNAYNSIKTILSGQPEQKDRLYTYLLQQKGKLSVYNDYLKACLYLGLDMRMDRNLFPHDLQYWHNIRIDEMTSRKAREDEEARKELYAAFQTVAAKYATLENNKKHTYIAILAKSPGELIREGEVLHHCVGRLGYDQKFIRGESLIFFIREASQPDKPLVTVEYSPKTKKVLQCYGDDNAKPGQDIEHFVFHIWLPYANRQLKKIPA